MPYIIVRNYQFTCLLHPFSICRNTVWPGRTKPVFCVCYKTCYHFSEDSKREPVSFVDGAPLFWQPEPLCTLSHDHTLFPLAGRTGRHGCFRSDSDLYCCLLFKKRCALSG